MKVELVDESVKWDRNIDMSVDECDVKVSGTTSKKD